MITIFLLALLAAADPIGCPKTIQVKEQLASLAPDGTTTQRNETVSTCKFELPRHTSTCARYLRARRHHSGPACYRLCEMQLTRVTSPTPPPTAPTAAYAACFV
jgi:hypothetical protein